MNIWAYFVLCLLPLAARGQEIGCFDAGECYNGVAGIITSTVDANACLAECKDDPACLYFTYNKDTDVCLHLSDCTSLTNMYNTYLFTGHASCDYLECGSHGHCDGNFVSIITAETVDDCFNACAVDYNCDWWTYSYSGDQFCSLLSNCPRVDTSCDYCLYGQRACNNATNCPPGWESYPSSSYCVQLVSGSLVYSSAQAACLSAGPNGNLVSIHNQVQQDFLVNLIETAGITDNVWIGLNDLVVEGNYQWLDGSELDFTLWADNQPDDSGFDNMDGGHLWNAQGWKWNDAGEANAFSYICQIDRQ